MVTMLAADCNAPLYGVAAFSVGIAEDVVAPCLAIVDMAASRAKESKEDATRAYLRMPPERIYWKRPTKK